ncbi:hypothetical protein GIB67_015676 [Kingdonia uniflora]|uniref:Protein kinase domain-containing protein n=1 Tax=Kingdonia uniflora TaxID=39325 RepID=A0A7J7NUT5_9MAGN|nr:hypothetical protein GIB67_015676 [Kingdonia uniflora]
MTVDEGFVEKNGVEEGEKKRVVLVGLRLDRSDRLLLNWALVKVAEEGDRVVAIHVCKDSLVIADPSANDKPSLEGYLDVYKGLCNVKQLDLTGQIFHETCVRKVLVRKAKLCSAMAVVVGVGRYIALGNCVSVAKYCAKRLPQSTTVIALHKGKIVFGRGFINQTPGAKGDPRPSFSSIQSLISVKEEMPSFGASDTLEIETIAEEKPREEDSNDIKRENWTIVEYMEEASDSISELIKELPEPRPGWPLLRKASSVMPEMMKESGEARKKSVVQWVMSLPNRTPSISSHTPNSFRLNRTESLFEKAIIDDDKKSDNNFISAWGLLPKELELLLRTNSSTCRWFGYKELKNATSQFSSDNLIGKGGCSRVYRGALPGGKPVAVKILKLSKEAWKEFILEIDIISSLQHKHITPLIGVCLDDSDLILVYDFLSKGSLEENLQGRSALSWEVRFKVAVGVAEAINYLHKESPRPVIHRDVKSSNILLSDDFEPQLSDFGLAIWGQKSSSYEIHSDVLGTFGYIAPEYFMYGKVSEKIDVFSFGVVLLELLSGRKPISNESPKGQENLVMWARPILKSGDILGLLDPNLAGIYEEAQMRRMVLVVTLCITRSARIRPQMSQILKLLLGEKDVEEWVLIHAISDEEEDDIQDGEELSPESSMESHLGIAMLDVDGESTSFSSIEQTSHYTLQDYLKGRWSRSSSFD